MARGRRRCATGRRYARAPTSGDEQPAWTQRSATPALADDDELKVAKRCPHLAEAVRRHADLEILVRTRRPPQEQVERPPGRHVPRRIDAIEMPLRLRRAPCVPRVDIERERPDGLVAHELRSSGASGRWRAGSPSRRGSDPSTCRGSRSHGRTRLRSSGRRSRPRTTARARATRSP